MKSLYISSTPITSRSGVGQKICGTVTNWNALGVPTRIFDLHSGGPVSLEPSQQNVGTASSEKRPLRWQWPFIVNQQYKKALSFVETEKPDFVYMREAICTPSLLQLMKKFPTFIEVNSIASNEIRQRSTLAALYWDRTSPFALKKAQAVVGVTNEVLQALPFLPKLQTVIPNGIEIRKLNLGFASTERPSVLFVSDTSKPWHGLDKIISFATANTEFDFHIVGLDGESATNLQFHGSQDVDYISALANSMTVGISSLALHRNGMEEACPLKTRLYLERGLPIIYGYNDLDIPDDVAFALRIPNREDSLVTARTLVYEFIMSAHSNIELRKAARIFAENTLAHEQKECRRLEFIQNSLTGSNKQ